MIYFLKPLVLRGLFLYHNSLYSYNRSSIHSLVMMAEGTVGHGKDTTDRKEITCPTVGKRVNETDYIVEP